MSLGAPLQRLARDATRFTAEWPREGAEIIQRAIEAEISSAPGGGSVSRIGTATVDVDAEKAHATVSAGGSLRLWSWMEGGTSAHVVTGRPLLRTPYGPRPRVRVRGWRARHTWTNGIEAADPQVIRDAYARLDAMGG